MDGSSLEEAPTMTTVDESATAVAVRHTRTGSVLPPALVVLVIVAVGVVGLQAHVRAGLSTIDGVGFGLVLAWALTGLVLAREADRTPAWLVLGGTLAASVALAADRVAAGETGGGHDSGARILATLVGMLIIAVTFQTLLSLPDGRLRTGARRVGATSGYIAALAVGLVFVLRSHPFPVLAAAICWILAALSAWAPLRSRYASSLGPDRERLQWMGIGTVVSADVALVAGVLHLLVAWPTSLAAVTAGATVLIPVGLMVGHATRLAPRGGRLFVQLLSIVGFTMVVSAIYLVIVLGLGHAPTDPADRKALGLSMLAAAVAAVGYVPAQRRLLGSATRLVYGSRQAPDEVLRTFGSRLTRAVAMDELLLQMAESLRKTMALTSAEVYTGVGDVLERAVSVPDSGSSHGRRLRSRAARSSPRPASRGAPGCRSGCRAS